MKSVKDITKIKTVTFFETQCMSVYIFVFIPMSLCLSVCFFVSLLVSLSVSVCV